MKNNKVITVNGIETDITNCELIRGNYYIRGDVDVENSGECYFIEGKFWIYDQVVFDYRTKKYLINTGGFTNGVVAIENKEIKFGIFAYTNTTPLIFVSKGKYYYLMDSSILENNLDYRESYMDGNYYHISVLRAKDFYKLQVPPSNYKHSLPYDSRGNTEKYVDLYNTNYNPTIFNCVKKYTPILKNLSFGLEFETTKGLIPERLLNQYGLIPLRDGSISGIEYVTVPLSGEKGLQCVIDILSVLKKRTQYDDTCSLHLHLGNVPRTKEFILSFMLLTLAVQDSIFEMFPLYKKYNFGVKNKNYSAPFPTFDLLSQLDKSITPTNIDENFDVIYKFLAEESMSNYGHDLNQVVSHPSDPQGNQKWNIHGRYHITNIIPLLFGNKTTVEFRIHTPTYDVNKIIPFILINAILVNYAISEQENILKDRSFLAHRELKDIVMLYLHKNNPKDNYILQSSLVEYIQKRKSTTYNQNKRSKLIGEEEEISGASYIDWSVPNQDFSKNIIPDYMVQKMFIHPDTNKVMSYKERDNAYRTEKNKIKIDLKLGNIDEEIYMEKIEDLESKYQW